MNCLLIVDVQMGFINDATRHVPDRVAALQGYFDRVIVTRFVNPPGSFHRELIRWERFAPGSEETALAFQPRADAPVIDKATYSCLVPKVRTILEADKINVVHLCGIATDNCILKTAVDLFEARIKPVILVDACGSHGGQDCHDAGLLLLRRFIGADQVVESDRALHEIKLGG